MDAEATFPQFSRKAMDAQPASRSGPRLVATLVAASLHVAAISAFVLLFQVRHVHSPAADISIPVVFEPRSRAATEHMLSSFAASSLSVPTARVPASLSPLHPLTLPPASAPPRRVVSHAERPPAPEKAANQALTSNSVLAAQQSETQAAPLAASSADMVQAMARWEGRIRQAVQDAAIYPISARLFHREGRAQVRFDYSRGAVALVSIAQSSHVGVLDAAAVAAVTRAVMPDPPAEIRLQKRTMLVWVQFRLQAED